VSKLSAESALRTVTSATPTGRAAMDCGPAGSEIVAGCKPQRISESDAVGFVLDDFPRTLDQARAFDVELAKSHCKLDAVLELKVAEGALLDRVIHRACLAKAKGLPVCADDDLEVFRIQMEAYRVHAEPLAEYYRSVDLLVTVNGLLPIDEVTTLLIDQLQKGLLRGTRHPAARALPGSRPTNPKNWENEE
jgi:adenylate kinase